jgi:predicted Ser/Thr protein kinase
MTESDSKNFGQAGSQIDRLIAEYLDQRDQGQEPDREAFLAAHPAYAAELRAFFADDEAVGEVRGELPQSATGVEYVPGDVLAERYRLLEQIGEGGMGAVWLARQLQPVQRDVAVKLIRPGMDSRQILSRFEAERQVLAMMEHPNIARILDAGVTASGRPFFVMEYLRGVPLTTWCDTARLNLRQRLELFIPVCQAIQHAHTKGIVHRDLKPSNILVCLYDGVPVPRVIDFGLARALADDRADESLRTQHGQMVGTPLYMSPEQAEFNNLDIDTRTDVYSLGVILYELLTGTTPLERDRLQQAGLERMLQLIRNEDPPAPSLRVSSGRHATGIAEQRSIQHSHLQRELRGDLDWIVMRALEKERTRRYGTAASLGQDLQRYLSAEPVEAGPPGLTYRLRKLVRRHRAAVLTATVCCLGTVVAIAGLGYGWTQSYRAATLAQQYLNERLLGAIGRTEDVEEYGAGLLLAVGFGFHGVGIKDLEQLNASEREALSMWSTLPDARVSLAVLEQGLLREHTALCLTRRSTPVLLACGGMDQDRRAVVHKLLHEIQTAPQYSAVTRVAACILAIRDESQQVDVSGCVDVLLEALGTPQGAELNGMETRQMLRELRLRLLSSICRSREGNLGRSEQPAFAKLLRSLTTAEISVMPEEEEEEQLRRILESSPTRVATLAPDWFWKSRLTELSGSQPRSPDWDEAGFPMTSVALPIVARELPEEHVLRAAEACVELLPHVDDDHLTEATQTLLQRLEPRVQATLSERISGSLALAAVGERSKASFSIVLRRCGNVLVRLLPGLPAANQRQFRGHLLEVVASEMQQCDPATANLHGELLALSIRTDNSEDIERANQDIFECLNRVERELPQRFSIVTPSLARLMPRLTKVQVNEWLTRLLAATEQLAAVDSADQQFPGCALEVLADRLPPDVVEQSVRQLLEWSEKPGFEAGVVPLIPVLVAPTLPRLPAELKFRIREQLRQAVPKICSQRSKRSQADQFPVFVDVLVRLEQTGDLSSKQELADSILSIIENDKTGSRAIELAVAVFVGMPELLADNRGVSVWNRLLKLSQRGSPAAELLAAVAEKLSSEAAEQACTSLLSLLAADYETAPALGPALHKLAEMLPEDHVADRLKAMLRIDADHKARVCRHWTALRPVYRSLCRRLPESELLETVAWILKSMLSIDGPFPMASICFVLPRCTESNRAEIGKLLFEYAESVPQDERYAGLVGECSL